jgi:UDP-glucose 4-epimerase
VVGYDNLSTGRLENLKEARRRARFRLVRGDLSDAAKLRRTLKGCDAVYHLAANADVRFGPDAPTRDLAQNAIGTSNLLEAMRKAGCRRILFSSSGSVYGEPEVFPTPEDAPFPIQTSLYAASKVAAEGMIEAYCHAFGFQAWIFRFVSIMGERYSHGHVLDFYRKLKSRPARLRVLGNGKQRKSYLYVQDCLSAMRLAQRKAGRPINLFNLGTDEYCTVDQSLDWICAELGVSPKREYAGGVRGWVGDSPFILLNCSRIRKLGWKPKLTIRQAVLRTLRDMVARDA